MTTYRLDHTYGYGCGFGETCVLLEGSACGQGPRTGAPAAATGHEQETQ